jgi:hypothetical protein
VDPLSLLITAWLVYLFLQRLPETLWEWEYAKRGEQSPAEQARVRRLTAAGIDPATGGAMRQFIGNAWRDLWLDLEEGRVRRRAGRGAESGGGWVTRLRQRLDDAIGARGARWRSQPRPDRAAGLPDPTPPPQDPPPARQPAAEPGHNDTQPPEVAEGIIVIVIDDDALRPDPTPQPSAHLDGPAVPAAAGPVTAVIEGEIVSTVAVSVTGVLSGAAEARAIAAQVDATTMAYAIALTKLRQRVQALGEAVVNNVELRGNSHVAAAVEQAAEALAATQASAISYANEVTLALAQIQRAFSRITT